LTWKIPLEWLDYDQHDPARKSQSSLLKFVVSHVLVDFHHTVDGRHLAAVDKYFIPFFTRFHTSQVVSRISEPTTNSISLIHLNKNPEQKPSSWISHHFPEKATILFWLRKKTTKSL